MPKLHKQSEKTKLTTNSPGFQRCLDFKVIDKGLRTCTTSLESKMTLYSKVEDVLTFQPCNSTPSAIGLLQECSF